MDFKELSESFIKHGIYLRGWSKKTVRTYRQGLSSFQQSQRATTGTSCEAPAISMAQLEAWVVWMRERGLTAGGCNMYIRTMNSFLSWLAENGFLPQRQRIKLLPNPPKPLRGLSDSEIRLLLAWKPKGRLAVRTHTLILCLADTGVRIDDALGLERKNVDLDELSIKVLGKGNKERLVPISLEFRKHLFKLLSKSEGRFVFSCSSGHRLSYRNAYRDIKTLCKRAGVEGEHVHPHSFRHFFAVGYIRNGGDIYRLSRILGHTSINTTQLYLRSMGVEHLLEGHSQFSPLARMV